MSCHPGDPAIPRIPSGPRPGVGFALLAWSVGLVLLLACAAVSAQGAYTWLDTLEVRDGVQGGNERNGQAVYVAAGWFEGRWIIGKARGRECWVPYGGGEHVCQRFRRLSCDSARWVDAGREIPSNAVALDEAAGGPRYYVARARFQGLWVPGKTRADSGTCWISFAGKEHVVHQYQVLVTGSGHHHSGGGSSDDVEVYVIPHSSASDGRVRDYLRSHGMRRTRDLDSADGVLAVCRCYASNNLAPRYQALHELEDAIEHENSTWSNGPNLGIYLYERASDGSWRRR